MLQLSIVTQYLRRFATRFDKSGQKAANDEAVSRHSVATAQITRSFQALSLSHVDYCTECDYSAIVLCIFSFQNMFMFVRNSCIFVPHFTVMLQAITGICKYF
jgi:hypothetical protein